jgi:hypothetical protein
MELAMAGNSGKHNVRDAELPHAVIQFRRAVRFPRFSMSEGERWGLVVWGKNAERVEAIKAGERFDFAGGQCLAEDVELIYEGPANLEFSRAAGYLDSSAGS